MVRGIHHVGVCVRDLARATTFLAGAAGLQERLQFRRGRNGPSATGDDAARGVLLAGPNGYVELTEAAGRTGEPAAERPVCDAGITHFCVQHQQIETLFGGFRTAGASAHADPVALGTGFQYCYVRDPELNVIELEGAPMSPHAGQPWLAHVAIATPDLNRLAEFYARALRRDVSRRGQYGPNPLIDRVTNLRDVRVHAAWIDVENLTLELWQYLNPPTMPAAHSPALSQPGYTHLSFEVDDLETDCGAFVSAGMALVDGPVELDGCQVVYGQDPDGNVVQLIQVPPTRPLQSLAALPDLGIVWRVAAARRQHQATQQ